MHIRFLADLIENYVLTRLPGICYFLDKREARKSLKAFLLQPRLKPNIRRKVFFLFAVRTCLKQGCKGFLKAYITDQILLTYIQRT